MRYTYIFILLALFSACNEDDKDDSRMFRNIGDMATCHENEMWDSTSLFQAVLGEWEWEQQYFAWTAEIDDEEFEDLELNFRSDGTVQIEWEGNTDTFPWRIEDAAVIIDQGRQTYPVHGWFYLCDDEMMFANSPVDGNDHTFSRDD
jgi:hypothetical protein